jgi:hypothetical protein
VSVLVLLVDDEPDVEALFRQPFRRDLRAKRFVMDFAIAGGLMGRLIEGEEVGVKALSLLRQCLNSMGATPADASNVKMPADEEPDDPARKYFT